MSKKSDARILELTKINTMRLDRIKQRDERIKKLEADINCLKLGYETTLNLLDSDISILVRNLSSVITTLIERAKA